MFKDEEISKRHRLWGWNVPVVDIDFLNIENKIMIEFKEKQGLNRIINNIEKGKGAGTNYTAMKELSEIIGYEYYISVYNSRHFYFYPANKIALEKYKSNFKIKIKDFDNFISNKLKPNIFSFSIDMNKHIDNTYIPKHISKSFQYKVSPERTSWRDINLDSINTNNIDSFLGIEYNIGKPVILVEYIDKSLNKNSLKNREDIYSINNFPLISLYYYSENLIKNNVMEIKLESQNELGKNILKKYFGDDFTNNFFKESQWIEFLYKVRGFNIDRNFLMDIKKEIDKNISKNLRTIYPSI